MFTPGPSIEVTQQHLMQVLVQLGHRQLTGRTFTEDEARLYEHACACTARFAEARTLELEAAIRKCFPDARKGSEQTD